MSGTLCREHAPHRHRLLDPAACRRARALCRPSSHQVRPEPRRVHPAHPAPSAWTSARALLTLHPLLVFGRRPPDPLLHLRPSVSLARRTGSPASNSSSARRLRPRSLSTAPTRARPCGASRPRRAPRTSAGRSTPSSSASTSTLAQRSSTRRRSRRTCSRRCGRRARTNSSGSCRCGRASSQNATPCVTRLSSVVRTF